VNATSWWVNHRTRRVRELGLDDELRTFGRQAKYSIRLID
jgi:hypothetical protein